MDRTRHYRELARNIVVTRVDRRVYHIIIVYKRKKKCQTQRDHFSTVILYYVFHIKYYYYSSLLLYDLPTPSAIAPLRLVATYYYYTSI